MKKIIIAIGILVGLVITIEGFSQSIDQQRMDRDLKVAENILSTLSNQDADRLWGEPSVESTYIEGYGVIFTLPRNFVYNVSRGSIAIGRSSYIENGKIKQDVKEYAMDSLREAVHNKTIEVMKTFLVDYADLIGQLKNSDKIMIVQKNASNSWSVGPTVIISGDGYYTDDARKNSQLSAEIIKSDLNDYKQGRISREQALKKIVMNENLKDENKKEPDLELFASIIGRLYRTDLSSTYFSSGIPSYDRLAGFGVIYIMRVYSSNRMAGDFYSIPTLDQENVPQAERDQKVTELYPKFEQDIKKNMVEYGRTIRSLKEDENLMMKIRLTECKGCNMPESIDLTIKKSVLTDYEKGNISLEQAVAKISVNKYPQK